MDALEFLKERNRMYESGAATPGIGLEDDYDPYKRANSLETFRRYITEIPRRLRENYIYKVGAVYGNVIEAEKPIEFYF